MAQTRFNIEVTQAQIDRAERNDSHTCMVAQAVAKAIPDATHIDVDMQTIRFTLRDERLVYLTPYVVQGYIVAFDAGDKIHPFKFQIRDPRKVRRHVKTEAGKAVARVTERSRRRRKRETVDVAGVTSTPDPEVESVKAAYEGQAKTKSTEGDVRRAPPRVFKRKKRSYGQRILRINREDTLGSA